MTGTTKPSDEIVEATSLGSLNNWLSSNPSPDLSLFDLLVRKKFSGPSGTPGEGETEDTQNFSAVISELAGELFGISVLDESEDAIPESPEEPASGSDWKLIHIVWQLNSNGRLIFFSTDGGQSWDYQPIHNFNSFTEFFGTAF